MTEGALSVPMKARWGEGKKRVCIIILLRGPMELFPFPHLSFLSIGRAPTITGSLSLPPLKFICTHLDIFYAPFSWELKYKKANAYHCCFKASTHKQFKGKQNKLNFPSKRPLIIYFIYNCLRFIF